MSLMRLKLSSALGNSLAKEEAEDERGGLQNAGRVAPPQTVVPAFLLSSPHRLLKEGDCQAL